MPATCQKDRTEVSTTPHAQPLLLNVQQLAQLLGVSTRHIWRMRDSGQLPPAIKLGAKIVKWSREDVVAWIRRSTETQTN